MKVITKALFSPSSSPLKRYPFLSGATRVRSIPYHPPANDIRDGSLETPNANRVDIGAHDHAVRCALSRNGPFRHHGTGMRQVLGL
jgi:hypothetical protein